MPLGRADAVRNTDAAGAYALAPLLTVDHFDASTLVDTSEFKSVERDLLGRSLAIEALVPAERSSSIDAVCLLTLINSDPPARRRASAEAVVGALVRALIYQEDERTWGGGLALAETGSCNRVLPPSPDQSPF